MWDKITDFTDQLDWSDVFFIVSGFSFGITAATFWINFFDDVREWGAGLTLLLLLIWVSAGIISMRGALKYKESVSKKAGVVQK